MKKLLSPVLLSATLLLGIAGCSPADPYRNPILAPAAVRAASIRPQVEWNHPGDCPEFNTEEYKSIDENQFLTVDSAPLSTFGADVDTASYANVRRMLLHENRLPVRDAVRLEEFLNYFTYDYALPAENETFAVTFEMDECPWRPEHQLLLIGVQGMPVARENLPPSNFVFLIDNSGSMAEEMPLLIESMQLLAEQLRPEDRVSVVTYGGGARVMFDSLDGSSKEQIKAGIAGLNAGGYTPGAAGIQTAYQLAEKNFIKGGNNRVILVTDGDFNVGVSSESELVELIEKKRESGVYLTAVGMGYGNFKDNKLKMLANRGNGNYIYIDNAREARNALVNEMSGRLYTLARDVKFQLEFNPAEVYAYRLLGYELRRLNDRDFNDDARDSGEIGVGHQVTALYELVMADAPDMVKKEAAGDVDALKYQKRGEAGASRDLLSFKLRYLEPEGDAPSRLMEFVLPSRPGAGVNWQWASAVAEFGLLLRNSPFKGNAGFESVQTRAQRCLGSAPDSRRAEFLTLAAAARELSGTNEP